MRLTRCSLRGVYQHQWWNCIGEGVLPTGLPCLVSEVKHGLFRVFFLFSLFSVKITLFFLEFRMSYFGQLQFTPNIGLTDTYSINIAYMVFRLYGQSVCRTDRLKGCLSIQSLFQLVFQIPLVTFFHNKKPPKQLLTICSTLSTSVLV